METKMTTIPFDMERAKRIQAGEETGKIITRYGKDVRIICWDRDYKEYPIIGLLDNSSLCTYTKMGKLCNTKATSSHNLVLQVPEYTQFKDGEVLSSEDGDFVFMLNKNGRYKTSQYVCLLQNNKISFGGAADADHIERYRYATEEEKQKLIDALKQSYVSKAKEYLKRFFNIEEESQYEIKPFDKVLVRNGLDRKWRGSLFCYYDGTQSYPFVCVNESYKYCIAYNDNTKHLLGTIDNLQAFELILNGYKE